MSRDPVQFWQLTIAVVVDQELLQRQINRVRRPASEIFAGGKQAELNICQATCVQARPFWPHHSDRKICIAGSKADDIGLRLQVYRKIRTRFPQAVERGGQNVRNDELCCGYSHGYGLRATSQAIRNPLYSPQLLGNWRCGFRNCESLRGQSHSIGPSIH